MQRMRRRQHDSRDIGIGEDFFEIARECEAGRLGKTAMRLRAADDGAAKVQPIAFALN